MDFLLLQCDPRTDLISLKKHLDQGFGEEKQSSGSGRKEDGQIWKEGKPTEKASRQNTFISKKILLMNVSSNTEESSEESLFKWEVSEDWSVNWDNC